MGIVGTGLITNMKFTHASKSKADARLVIVHDFNRKKVHYNAIRLDNHDRNEPKRDFTPVFRRL